MGRWGVKCLETGGQGVLPVTMPRAEGQEGPSRGEMPSPGASIPKALVLQETGSPLSATLRTRVQACASENNVDEPGPPGEGQTRSFPGRMRECRASLVKNCVRGQRPSPWGQAK